MSWHLVAEHCRGRAKAASPCEPVCLRPGRFQGRRSHRMLGHVVYLLLGLLKAVDSTRLSATGCNIEKTLWRRVGSKANRSPVDFLVTGNKTEKHRVFHSDAAEE